MAPRHRAEPAWSHIKDLTPDPANRRTHNPRNVGMLVDALQKVGVSRSIVVDEDGVILAGNGVVEAASEAGITKLQIVEADGETLVAVRRRGLTPEQKRALAIYDNRTAELAEWNVEQLAADLKNGEDLSAFFYEDELKTLLAGVEGVKAGLTDPDDVPAERPTGIVAGDLFELGAHRLLCGDSTSGADVARLMRDSQAALVLTDPPYPREYEAVWVALGELARQVSHPNAFLVTLCGHYQLPLVLNTVLAGGWEFYWPAIAGNQNQPIMHGFSVKCSFKPCLVFRTGNAKPRRIWIDNFALRTKTSEWIESQMVHKWGQATGLWYEPLEAFCEPGALVYEPFSGGGTTMIACELYGSPCYAIEIDPSCCQVTIDRWEAFTGQKAQKVGEAVLA